MIDSPSKILASNQATGNVFRPVSGAHIISLAGYSGAAAWVLQSKHPEQVGGVDVWLDSDVTFDSNDVKSVVLSNAFEYRLHGGVIGASAYLGVASFGTA